VAERLATCMRTLLYLVAAVPLGAAGLTVLIAGWSLALSLAITPLVVPVLVGFRVAVGGIARLEAVFANALLGTSVHAPIASRGRRGKSCSSVRTSRSSTSGCRRRSATRVCAPRSSCAGSSPGPRC